MFSNDELEKNWQILILIVILFLVCNVPRVILNLFEVGFNDCYIAKNAFLSADTIP